LGKNNPLTSRVGRIGSLRRIGFFRAWREKRTETNKVHGWKSHDKKSHHVG